MNNPQSFDFFAVGTMTGLIDALFSEMNIGLLIYQLENVSGIKNLKLVYANRQAAKYTGVDLSQQIGRYILDIFPALAATDLPQIFAEVINTKQSHNIGAMEYQDENVQKGYYASKAFPMPNACVGVIFENITLRKRLEEMHMHEKAQLERNKNAVQDFCELLFNQGQPAKALAQYAGETYIEHHPEAAGGKEACIAYYTRLAPAAAGQRLHLQRVIAEGHHVALHSRQQAPGQIDWARVDIFRLEDNGKIAEHWEVQQAAPNTP